MRAIWLERKELKYRDDIPVPTLQPGEALVAVRQAGICATDLELVKGYYPFTGIPGHEFVGEIVESPDSPERVGERVVGEINATCGTCRMCMMGYPNHCKHRNVLGILNRHGAFADYLSLPLKNLIHVPDAVPDDAAVFVEPLAAALEIVEQVKICPTDNVLVLGAGRLGQLIARVLALTGCKLQVVTRYDRQKELLTLCNIPWIEEAVIRGSFFDIVVEATGSAGGFGLACNAVRPRGTVVLKSTYAGDFRVNFSSVVVDEISIIGSRCGPFEPALRLIQNHWVDTAGFIEGRYPLENALPAFDRAGQPGCFKYLIQVGE